MEKTIEIAKEFTVYPSGRYYADGEFTGQRFREEFLIPSLNENDKVIVVLDGVRGYGSSFLEEAFGGLVRNKIFTKSELKTKLEIVFKQASLESYADEIWDYINDAS